MADIRTLTVMTEADDKALGFAGLNKVGTGEKMFGVVG